MAAKRPNSLLLGLCWCLGIVLLAPSLTQAAVLEVPGDGAALSGIGVISGWKCEAIGDITVRIDGGDPIPMLYGSERGDTRQTADGEIICGDTDNGFLAIFNYAILGDGPHTAVAYDKGLKFDSSTFEVATFGEEVLRHANTDPFPLRVPDFPSHGEEAWFEWNESTQHLELVSVTSANICKALEIPIGPPPGPPPPLVLPPPRPCPGGAATYQGDKYLIRFHPPFYSSPTEDIGCTAPRGVMQIQIRGGKFSISRPAPPHGEVRVSGDVCDKESGSIFIGQWSLDGVYNGYFTGSLSDLDGIACQSRWHDRAGCRGDLVITPLP